MQFLKAASHILHIQRALCPVAPGSQRANIKTITDKNNLSLELFYHAPRPIFFDPATGAPRTVRFSGGGLMPFNDTLQPAQSKYGNPFLFNGRYWDPELTQYDYRRMVRCRRCHEEDCLMVMLIFHLINSGSDHDKP